jgi:Rrf2 family transcriptional regulator, cysteine metabolism repressor
VKAIFTGFFIGKDREQNLVDNKQELYDNYDNNSKQGDRMKLSTRTRYGMRALMDLTLHSTGQPVQLKDIAERQSISLSYLEHLVIPMIAAGIIQSTRGAHGGIKLSRPPDQIKLDEILEVLEGPLAPVDCLREAAVCRRSGACATQEVWHEMKTAMLGVLKSKSLQDLAESQKVKDKQPSSMYYI